MSLNIAASIVVRHLRPKGRDQGVPRELMLKLAITLVDTLHASLILRTFKQDCQAHMTLQVNENRMALDGGQKC